MDFAFPSYGNKYADQVKTYRVLQGILDLYRNDSLLEQAEDDDTALAKGKEIARSMPSKHGVFTSFNLIEDENMTNPSFRTPEGEDYFAWEWTASRPQAAPARKSKRLKTIDYTQYDFDDSQAEDKARHYIYRAIQCKYADLDIRRNDLKEGEEKKLGEEIFTKILADKEGNWTEARERKDELYAGGIVSFKVLVDDAPVEVTRANAQVGLDSA